MRKIDFPVAYTLDYVMRYLPEHCHRILEVGCGSGDLARNLIDLGYEVVGVDDDPDAVAAARRLGVTAHRAEWPALDVTDFDAVLFTRSLHHMQSLRQALNRARSVLNPGGRLIVEDFRYDDMDERTITWFAGTTRLLTASGVLDCHDSWLAELSAAVDPVPLWRASHDHDLQSANDIDEILREIFVEVERKGTAYFFRYISRAISDENRRSKVGKAFAELEELLATSDQIRALGQRFVAKEPLRAETVAAQRG